MTTTVLAHLLQLLGVQNTLSHVSQYTSSACGQKLVANGEAAVYVSHSSNATLHTAQFTDTDAIFTDSYGRSNWADTASASKLICETASSELTPLGSAEWIKVTHRRGSPFRGIQMRGIVVEH